VPDPLFATYTKLVVPPVDFTLVVPARTATHTGFVPVPIDPGEMDVKTPVPVETLYCDRRLDPSSTAYKNFDEGSSAMATGPGWAGNGEPATGVSDPSGVRQVVD